MFISYASSIHLLEMVSVMCHLPSHSYLREVRGDGSLLGGVELDVDVVQEGAMTTRFFFWSCVSHASCCPYEEPALQAVWFLQHLYGFVVSDFNYEGMVAYRELARSAIVLAVSLARSANPASNGRASGSLGFANEMSQWHTLCNQLISSACDM
uniref:Uncharacterized protein n=1 Tax=Avena sativa TaxID=4498 RepID=A0ACD5V873_AVESA